ncbi:MAG: polyphosphate kinase 1 [Xanthomonadales bacterium]|nr:polyphosphate kinase 1 [Xanthomonadales bacterium]
MPRALADPRLFCNRELSQIEFNRRVLEQAIDPDTPLLERVRFLCISCTNLDEFFEVRVASLKQRMEFGSDKAGPDGLTPVLALEQIREKTLALVDDQYHAFNEIVTPALAEEGIRVLRRDTWTEPQRKWLRSYYHREVLPVLSPLGLDPVHPFPRLLNKSLNFAVVLKGKDAFGREGKMALLRAPRSLPRIIEIPGENGNNDKTFVFLSSVLHAFVDELFSGMSVEGCYQFRVTRNSELYVDEEEVEDLAHALKGELLERSFAKAVRLEVAHTCPPIIRDFLADRFEVDADDVYPCNGPVNLNRLIAVYDLVNRADLKFPGFLPFLDPALAPGNDLFRAIRRTDVLLHHPYDSFLPVIDLIRQAASDPNVLAIKQTLYRTGEDSPIVGLLIEAARAGKDITAVIELRARFDEQENIELANRLQEAGVQVVYGVVGHKTHAKLLLIVRREGKRLKRYAHLGTGNYHHRTAAAYTDLGLLTCNAQITADVHELFQQLTGLGKRIKLHRLFQSPFTLRDMLLRRIRREIKHCKKGKPGRIVARMNALTEPGIIRALYQASQAGVKVDLIIRGSCCLRPGIKGVSDNITVRSVVGRFLEHSRIYYFLNDGKEELFGSSADWMDRNLFSRVESCFPLLDPEIAARVKHETLSLYLKDNCQSWLMNPDGGYTRVTPGRSRRFSAQEELMNLATERSQG